jgi:RNA polymerase sigma factor for flagellar operon FliA
MATAAIRFETVFEASGPLYRDQLIEEHYPLVTYLASRLSSKLPPSIDVDDLVGAGVLGLIDAADKFDPARGVRFRTYAERRIRGAILDHLRSLDWAPRSLRRRAREIEGAYGTLEREHGRAVSESEVAAFLHMELAELQDLAFEISAVQVSSLTAADADDEFQGSRDLLDLVADTSDAGPFAACVRSEVRARLAQAIDRLRYKERLVISFYYVEELTMKEIGSILGVNESRVSQLHTRAIQRLRASLGSLAA